MEADRIGIELANKVGYAPNGSRDVLKKLDARNTRRAGAATACSRRIRTPRTASTSIEKTDQGREADRARRRSRRATRRYITFDAKPVAEIATVVAGARAWPAARPERRQRKEGRRQRQGQERRRTAQEEGRLRSASMSLSGGSQAQSSQTVGIGRRRAVASPIVTPRAAPTRASLGVTITPAELEAFKKGIVGVSGRMPHLQVT